MTLYFGKLFILHLVMFHTDHQRRGNYIIVCNYYDSRICRKDTINLSFLQILHEEKIADERIYLIGDISLTSNHRFFYRMTIKDELIVFH
jgi:hypothetical protein